MENEKKCHKCNKEINEKEPYTYEDKEFCCNECCHKGDDDSDMACEFC